MKSRREFLRDATLLLAPLGVGCATVPTVVDARPNSGVTLGLFPRSASVTTSDAILSVLEQQDLSWLKRGDRVLLKVACNSGNAHPATTSPVAVATMTRALLARGASEVIVGDQGGVSNVRLAKGNRRFRSTSYLMESNGIKQAAEAAGARVFCFDDGDYDRDYVEATLPKASTAWAHAPFIAKVATEVEHIIYLPRISAHTLCGYTHGHKIAVGWLRDDSRHEMHSESSNIYEKYTEINYCREIAERLRLVVTVAEEVLVSGGPDGGAIATADPRIVLASPHLANHDAVSVGLLTWARKGFEPARDTGGMPFGPWASATNLGFLAAVGTITNIPWTSPHHGLPDTYGAHAFDHGWHNDRALTRAYELLGGVPRSIAVDVMGHRHTELVAHLQESLPVVA